MNNFLLGLLAGAAVALTLYPDPPPRPAPCNCIPCTELVDRARQACDARLDVMQIRATLNQCGGQIDD